MEKVRAKFKCVSVTKYEFPNNTGVQLMAVSGGSKENDSFWDATPNGNMEMQVTNPEVAKMFEPGKEYYLDFTPAL